MKHAYPFQRSLAVTLFILFLAASFVKAQAQGRQVISLNDHWTFTNDSLVKISPVPVIPEQITIPHSWNTLDVLDDVPGYYRGDAQYKRTLKISSAFKGKAISLSFNGVGQQCEVYINGKLAGAHLGGYNRFIIPITHLLNENGTNELLVKASNKFNADLPPLAGDFTQFGGIYRSVNLIVCDPVHFSQKDFGGSGIYITTPKVTSALANVQVRTLIENTSADARKITLSISIRNAENETISTFNAAYKLAAGEQKEFSNALQPVANPILWSPETPYLYTVVTELTDDKTKSISDRIITPLGFRWFKFDANEGFFLNDKPYKLIGASRHQDYENLGNAVPEALQIRDVELLKEMGGNFLRVAHYPQDQSVMDACDRLGILTSVEIPIVNTITVSPAFTANAIQMQKEMIRQNFNHPSVVLWAYMNEVLLQPRYAGDTAKQRPYFLAIKELAQTLEDLTRKEDPSRYTMMANHGAFDLYHKWGLTKIPMVIGWNLYSGWYGGTLNDFSKFLDRHHKELPDKPLLVTEYGADADPRIRSFNPVRFDKSIEYAVKFHQVYLQDMTSRPFVAGGMAWNLSDFNSEFRSETMPHTNNKGLLTIGRQPKDTYWLYKSWLTKQPIVRIGGAGWPYKAGISDSASAVSTQQVQVITNSRSVELLVNGKSLGMQPANSKVAVFNVPFKNGINELTAITEDKATDNKQVIFNLVPRNFTDKKVPLTSMNVLLGADRYYFDQSKNEVWIPDMPYHKGGWGHVGGNAVKVSPPQPPYGSAKNINNTWNDPVYQTQQEGLTAYKLDVPDGQYQLTLHFAELTGGTLRKVVNDLSATAVDDTATKRVFNVNINGSIVLENFDMNQEYGAVTAGQKQFTLNITNGEGITINFESINGKTALNALQLRKIL